VHAWADHTKLEDLLGAHLDATPLREGLARTWAWARVLGPQEMPPFARVEVARGLPPSWRRRARGRATMLSPP
jgi:hypothetical protein